ncbi:T9SS C-terminal target domain-containing protein [Dokdonia sp. 4H-3-7-5]|uniref:T9SS C-terminal target domain-containing protein n=1 Tax=Dokdonia sp. (strain 4H-3-7-5) TaxID=983548 RepID=UPI00020A7339|nr:T9SS C-terminal target domain-containing protein [Dokdonia sp. 4H-3-7-5]AEE20301.1 conserved repeat domain protein [Dokdonia sp. 4H-3-7-5]
MMRKTTYPSPLNSFIVIFFLACFSMNAQEQSFATTILNQENVDNANLSVNGNLTDFAEVRANSGTLFFGAYDGILELSYGELLPANTTSYIKIETEDDLLPSLLGGNLGNLLADVLGIVLIGNQEFTVKALNGNTTVLSAVSSDPNSFSGARTQIVTDAQGDYYIALTPDQPYSSIEITNSIGSLIGLSQERSLRVYGAFFGADTPICNTPSFTSFDGTGLNLDLINLGGAGVTNIENAIDGDLTTFSELSLGVLSVAATIEQEIYFQNATQPTEDFKIRLAVDPSLLALGVANNIQFEAYNGIDLVATRDLGSLLNLELINLLQSNNPVDIGFDVSAPVDRIVVSYSSLLNTSLSQRLDLYDVAVTPAIPEIAADSQNITLCENNTADLTATTDTTNSQINWYDAEQGGTLLATVDSGEAFTTPSLTESATFYAAATANGCTVASVRTAVLVTINPTPKASDILVAGFDTAICLPEVLEIAPSSTISNDFKYYFDSNKNEEITNGLTADGIVYVINDSKLEITGLNEVNNPDNIFISTINPATGCENSSGDLRQVSIILANTPNVSINLTENITADDVVNSIEQNNDITISGVVTGDAQENDEVTITVNNTNYTAFLDATLSFATDISGAELVADADSTIDASITVVGSICTATAIDSEAYTVDINSPTTPTVDPQTTNDTTPLITGTADSDDELTVIVNGVTYTESDGNLIDNGDDTWSLQIPDGNEIPDGTYDVDASVEDTVGNTASDITTDELTIDSASPTTPTVIAQTTNDTTPLITGTADSEDELTVIVNGITYTESDGNLIDNGDDTWSLQIPDGNELPDGTYDVDASVEDTVGNTASDTTTDELVIDATAPTTPTVDPQTTNDSTPLITGTADSDDELTVIVNGITYTEGDGNLIDNGDNTWSLQIPDGSELPDGTYDVDVSVEDTVGNTASDATTDELTIDATAPTTPTVDPQTTNDTTPLITGTADSDDELIVIVNGVTYTEGDGNLIDNGDDTWSLQIPDGNELPDGTYDVDVSVEDTVGNTASDTTTDELIIDATAPTTPTVTAQTTNDTTPLITGTADSEDELTVIVNGVTYTEGDGNLIDNGDDTFSLQIPDGNELPDGTYDVDVSVEDTVGNTASDITTDELTVDSASPTTPTVDPQTTNDTTPLITGTADSDDELTVIVNGVTYTEGDGNLTDNGDDTFSLQIPDGNELPDGTYDVDVSVEDTVGNTASDITIDELTIDSASPTTPTVTAQTTNDTTPLITGTADSDDELTVIVNGITYTEGDGNLTDNGDDTFSLQIPDGNELPDGTYDVDLSVEDTVGNTASDTTTDELVIDATAPTTPTVDPQTTNDTTPLITGTADSDDELIVIVNGVTYTEGDTNLIDNGDDTWSLQIPDGSELPDGTYDVDASVEDTVGNTASDNTTDELVIDATAPTTPTVTAQTTNDTTPLITGTADSDDELTVIVNGITYTEGDGNLTDNGDDTFSLQIPDGNELPDGTYDVDVSVEDTVGNTASDITTDELTIDSASPTIPTVDPQTTNDTTPLITGTADSDDELTVIVNGITYTESDGNLTDNGDDTWSLQIPDGNELPDGTYDVDASVEDTVGNTASDTTTDELVIDATAPTTPTVDPQTTNDTTPLITGTADSDDELNVIVNGITYTEGDGNLIDNGDDTWSLQIPNGSELPDGTYDVDVSVEDTVGNTASDNTTDELTIDSASPTTPTVDPQITNDTTPLITGTADSDDELTVIVNGITYTEGDGNLTDNGDDTWSLQIPNGSELPDGTYDVDVSVEDTVGNTASDATTDELTIDATAPTTPTVDPQTANDTTPLITGTADSDDELTVIVNGVTYTEGDGNLIDNGDDTWSLQIPDGNELPDGTYDVDVSVEDTVGNTASDTTTDELIIDATAPTTPTVDPQTTNDTTPLITGTADSDDELTVIVNGITYTESDGNLTDNGDDTWSLQIPDGNEIPDGTYDVDVSVEDTVGNTASDITIDELSIDSASPTTPTVDPQTTNDTTPLITGTADSDDELTVIVNGVTYTEGDGNLTDNGDDTFSLQIPDGNELPDGTYDVDVSVEDTVGNTASDITTDELTIDSASPTTPTVDPQTTNDTTPLITGTADSDDELTVLVNGATYTEGDGNLTDNGDDTWSLQIPDGNEIPDGTYDVDVSVEDTVGNTASDITIDELTIDSASPTTPTVDPQTTNDNTPLITGTADSVDELTVIVNGVTYTEGDGNLTDNGDDTWSLQIPDGGELLDGTYDVDASVEDTVGNTASDTTTDELIIDTNAPSIPTVISQVTTDTTPIIEGTADSSDALTVTVDNTTYAENDGHLTDNGDNTWSLQIPGANDIADGVYDVQATTEDMTGNSASDVTTNELTVDTTAPIPPTVTAQTTNDTTPIITGTADSDDELTVIINGVTYTEGDGNLTDNGDDTWSLQIPDGSELADGSYDVDATAEDLAGNMASDTTVDELTIQSGIVTTENEQQLFCESENPTIANIQVNETSVNWYLSASGGTVLTTDTALTNNTIYYAALVTNGIESANRLAITVTIISTPTPTTTASMQSFCIDAMATVSDIDVNEPDVIWYAQATGGTPLAADALLVTGNYYGALVNNGCESSTRLEVSITIDETATASITSSTAMTCVGNEITYQTESDMSGYLWTISSGGTIITGGDLTDDFVTVIWNELGEQSVAVNYESTNSCMPLADATLDVEVATCSDLTILKTVNNALPQLNTEVVYTITVTNVGDTDFTDVEVQDILPSGLQFISAVTDSGTFDNAAGTWIIPEVMASATVVLEITAVVLEDGDYLNIATITQSSPMDSDLTNNVSQVDIAPSCIKVFNEFSPNGDGFNDTFTIRCIESYPENNLKIYNRAGNMVYEMDGYANVWRGTSTSNGTVNKNDGLPSSTYYYILDLKDGSEPLTGWVYIAL